jgi:hypothetical protein
MDFEGIIIFIQGFYERRFWVFTRGDFGGSLGTDLAVGIYRAHRG